jgi:hypothetical protein
MKPPDFRDVIGDDLSPAEAERLRRAHDLLVEAGPLPELPRSLEKPDSREPRIHRDDDAAEVFRLFPRLRSPLVLAAAIALLGFFAGYISGNKSGSFKAQFAPTMHGVGAAKGAFATIKIGKRDLHGNWPMQLDVRGLPRLKNGYYEMYLTHGKIEWTCGTFNGGGSQTVSVRLTAPYTFKRGDRWIVTKELPGQGTHRVVMTT